MATIAYLDIDQGSDFSAIIELENDNGTPMNLSGFLVYSQFRKSYGSAIGYSLNAVVLNADLGTIKLSLSGVASSAIKPGRYLYDIEIINTLLQIKTRVIEGVVTINAEITKIP
jgi:hypothetical protein